MYMKTTVFKAGTSDRWRAMALKDGEQTLQALCLFQLSVGRASRQALLQRGGTQAEPTSFPELKTYNGVWRDQVSRILQSKCQRGNCCTEKPQGLEQGDDQLRDVKKAPTVDKRTTQNEWKEQHPTITKGQESCCSLKTLGHWVECLEGSCVRSGELLLVTLDEISFWTSLTSLQGKTW